VFGDVLDTLGLRGYSEILSRNPDVDVDSIDSIRPGEKYGLPYVREVERPVVTQAFVMRNTHVSWIIESITFAVVAGKSVTSPSS
jgi:hypothetical protein